MTIEIEVLEQAVKALRESIASGELTEIQMREALNRLLAMESTLLRQP